MKYFQGIKNPLNAKDEIPGSFFALRVQLGNLKNSHSSALGSAGKSHESWDFLCFLLYLQCLEQYLSHNRYSLDIYKMKE